jgi:hypothetical protein
VEHYPCADLPPFLPEISCWGADAATALGLAGIRNRAATSFCARSLHGTGILDFTHYETKRIEKPGPKVRFHSYQF